MNILLKKHHPHSSAVCRFAAGGIAEDTDTIDDPVTKAPVILTKTTTGGEVNIDLSSGMAPDILKDFEF